MLLALPINYLLTTLPVFIIIILQFIPFDSKYAFKTEMTIAKTFMYVNNSINIFLYIFLGKNLRNDIFDIVLNFVNQQKKNNNNLPYKNSLLKTTK